MNFYDWINKKYLEYRGDAIGHNRTVTDFAAYIGVSQKTMSTWMARPGSGGRTPTSFESIIKLISKYGLDEVEMVLELDMDDKTLLELAQRIMAHLKEKYGEEHTWEEILEVIRGKSSGGGEKRGEE